MFVNFIVCSRAPEAHILRKLQCQQIGTKGRSRTFESIKKILEIATHTDKKILNFNHNHAAAKESSQAIKGKEIPILTGDSRNPGQGTDKNIGQLVGLGKGYPSPITERQNLQEQKEFMRTQGT